MTDIENKVDKGKIEQAVRMILEAIGENPEREGLRDTPARVARMYEELFAGLHQDPRQYLQVVFTEHHDQMIIVKDIPLYSICEHHLVPFVGKAHVVYMPREGKLIGLSKIARVVEVYARRPQVQERLTYQIAETFMEVLNPYGVMVVIEAEHMCMSMRGIRKPGTTTITSAVRGKFEKDNRSRSEALSLIMKDR
ncbi:MAG: GTP cyclohydrolase I FolE [Methylocystaceae bacterium]